MIEIKDHSGLSGIPKEIFSPENTNELITFLKNNTDSKFRIGAGLSGVSAAAVPLEDETFIDFSNFKELKWIDKLEGVFFAAAGNTMLEIKSFVEKEGWEFPILPGSLQNATIGGMIACNGGGPLSLSYGKIGNFIRAIEIICADGKKMNFGSLCKKISEGPDFTKLFIGSEGTLGFINNVILQCVKIPKTKLYRISHSSFYELANSIRNFIKLNPLYLEMAEPDALKFSSGEINSVIWLGLKEDEELDINNLIKLGFEISAFNSEYLKERFDIGMNLQSYKKFLDLDISFPLKHTAEILTSLKKLFNKNKLETAFFGHAGDGNWHIHVFYEKDNPIDEVISKSFDEILFKFGGHISGEHGIGRIHKERYIHFKDENYKNLYQALKLFLDPKSQLPSIF